MEQKEGKDVYILGGTETFIIPIEVTNSNGSIDYLGIAFSNNLTEEAGGYTNDLVIGFRSVNSIDLLIQQLNKLKEKLNGQ